MQPFLQDLDDRDYESHMVPVSVREKPLSIIIISKTIMMMQTTEDSCPIICNVKINAICLSSSTYVTGLDSCQSDVAKAGVHKNEFAALNAGLASEFTNADLNRFYYISDAEIPRQIIVKSATDAEIPRPRKNRGSNMV